MYATFLELVPDSPIRDVPILTLPNNSTDLHSISDSPMAPNLQPLVNNLDFQAWTRATQVGSVPKHIKPMWASCDTEAALEAFYILAQEQMAAQLRAIAAIKGRPITEYRVCFGISIKSGAKRLNEHMREADFVAGIIFYFNTTTLDLDLATHTIADMYRGDVAAIRPLYSFLKSVERRARDDVFNRLDIIMINGRGNDGMTNSGAAYLATPLSDCVMSCYVMYIEKEKVMPGATREGTLRRCGVEAADRSAAALQGAAAQPEALRRSADGARTPLARTKRSHAEYAYVDSALVGTNAAAAHAAPAPSAAATPPQVSPGPLSHFKRALGKRMCHYGTGCYRKGEDHWTAFDHPADHPFMLAPAPLPATTLASASPSASASTPSPPFQGMITSGPQVGYIPGSEDGHWAQRQKPIGSDYGYLSRSGPPTKPFPNTNPLTLREPSGSGLTTGRCKYEACRLGTMWLDTKNPWLKLTRKNAQCACPRCRVPRRVLGHQPPTEPH